MDVDDVVALAPAEAPTPAVVAANAGGSGANYTSVWYHGALRAQGRTFSPMRVAPERRQLVASLSQPVYASWAGS